MDFCSIASGSSGNCIFVGTEETGVLVDAGISGKRVAAGLDAIGRDPRELDAILITHEHSDHIKGLGVLARKYGIPVYASAGTIRALKAQQPVGELDAALFHEVSADEWFSIRDLDVCPFRISHDAAEPVAYRFNSGCKSVAVATDMGCYDDYTVAHLKDLDAVLVESNHDRNMLQVGTYPYYLKQRILSSTGHLSNEHAGRLLGEILSGRLQTILLGHLSKENNYEALALATVSAEITMGDNPFRAEDFQIQVAKRDEPSRLVVV